MSNRCLLLYGESDALRALKWHREILTLLREDQLGDALSYFAAQEYAGDFNGGIVISLVNAEASALARS